MVHPPAAACSRAQRDAAWGQTHVCPSAYACPKAVPAQAPARLPRRSSVLWRTDLSISFRRGISLVDPIAAEVLGDIKDLYVAKAHFVEGIISRFYIGTVVPWATSAIENDELRAAQHGNALAK